MSARVHIGIWDRLSKLVILLLLLAGVTAIFLWYKPLIQKNAALRKQILLLESQIQEEQMLEQNLTEAISALSDSNTIQRLARERLGYAKPGETVIRFEPDPRLLQVKERPQD